MPGSSHDRLRGSTHFQPTFNPHCWILNPRTQGADPVESAIRNPQSELLHGHLFRTLLARPDPPDDRRRRTCPRGCAEQPRTLYAGFDPTADSLHVGHLVPLMMLRRFQQAGHRPIALVGGATGMIGDPSGKSEERNLLSVEALRANVAGMEPQMRPFLDFDAARTRRMLVNNYDWMSRFGYLEFLRDVGKHFPVNVMLAKDSVKSRLERDDAGLSYTEFSYMLLAGLRLRAPARAATAASCRSAAAISGATSRPASTWPGACTACSSTASPARC